jgi:glycyl-tRNA synthetase beta chain
MQLAGFIAKQLGGNESEAIRAAELCKCDLMTEMVGEFPSLQGVMGRYYAQHDNEATDVATALDDYYRPRFAGDQLPENLVSQSVALADRIDTLVGIFAIGQIPTGDKDPYALRRAALGVLRILIEKDLDLDLRELLQQSAHSFDKGIDSNSAIEPVNEFILDRLKAYYKDKSIRPDVLDAVVSIKPSRPCDIDARIQAVAEFRNLAEAESLAAANKRIGNILKKVEGALPNQVDANVFVEAEETALFDQLSKLTASVSPLLEGAQYNEALSQLAGLRSPVDNFFDKVMVMADDMKLRNNRIAMLNQLHSLFMQVADISRLQG